MKVIPVNLCFACNKKTARKDIPSCFMFLICYPQARVCPILGPCTKEEPSQKLAGISFLFMQMDSGQPLWNRHHIAIGNHLNVETLLIFPCSARYVRFSPHTALHRQSCRLEAISPLLLPEFLRFDLYFSVLLQLLIFCSSAYIYDTQYLSVFRSSYPYIYF